LGGWPLTTILLDTHVWAWSLTNDRRITSGALSELERVQTVLVSAISFFEIAQKARLGKWPEMAPHVNRLSDLLERQRGIATALEAADSLLAGTMEWLHRDPFDRLLAASALRRGIAIVSADPVFDPVVARIW
jgi:PIN domain nuclease of toxin-antitoxin system